MASLEQLPASAHRPPGILRLSFLGLYSPGVAKILETVLAIDTSPKSPCSERRTMRYRVTVPFTGFLSRLETESSSIILPTGAMLHYLPISNHKPLLGMVRVLWQGREYSIFAKDLHEKCERHVDLGRSLASKGPPGPTLSTG